MITVHNDEPLGMGAHNGPDLHSYSRSHTHTHTQTLRWKWQEWKCQCRCLLPRARSVPNRSIEALLLLLATVLLVVATNPVLAWTAVPATTTHRGSGRSRSISRSISRSLPRQSTSTTRLEWSATNNSTDREPHNTATIGSNSNSNSNNDCLILVDADATFQAIPVLWNGTDDENKNKYNEEEDDSPNEASSLAAAATTTTTTTTSSSNYQTAELELELEETEKALVATATPSYTTKATTTTTNNKNNNNNNIEQATETPATPSDSSTTTTTNIREIAIVLNTNARGVTDDLVKAAREVVRDRNDAAAAAAVAVGGGGAAAAAAPVRVRVLVTSTHDEARAAARDIASNGHKTLVIPVGGDGTLTTTINLLWKERSAFLSSHSGSSSTGSNGNGNGGNDADVASRDSFPFLFGYVAMGTGNALGSVVGCRPVAGAAAAAAENGRNNNNNNNNNRRKRPRAIAAAAATVTRAWNKVVRPNRTKREEFKLVLEQLIEATATKQKQKQKRPTMAPPRAKQSFPSITTTDGPSSIGTDTDTDIDMDMDVDIVDLPLIHVRTTKVGSTTAVGAKDKKVVEEDHYAFFAGLGYDSLILQDYMDLQQQDNRNHSTAVGRLRRLATTGVLGYTVAMMTRSLPRVLKLTDASRLLRDVRITTDQPESAFWIDHRRGDLMRPAAAASAAVATDGVSAGNNNNNNNNNEQLLLYRGSAGIVAAGSVPYYGGGLRMFPFARMTPNGMHLRIGRRLHPIEGILSIPSIFKGSFRDHEFKCLDFVGNRFAVEIYESYSTDNSNSSSSNDSDADSENPLAGESGLNVFERKSSRTEAGFPVQHSGESVGRCTRVEFTVSSSSTAEDARSGSGTTDTRSRAAVPPPVRFVTLMPSRIVEERIDLDP